MYSLLVRSRRRTDDGIVLSQIGQADIAERSGAKPFPAAPPVEGTCNFEGDGKNDGHQDICVALRSRDGVACAASFLIRLPKKKASYQSLEL